MMLWGHDCPCAVDADGGIHCMIAWPVSFGDAGHIGHKRWQSLLRSLDFCCPSTLLHPAEVNEERAERGSLSNREDIATETGACGGSGGERHEKLRTMDKCCCRRLMLI